ncbi:MAG: tRNA (adenosine(37)-N6)-threonylcarbamoyltransferase complex dimerization subunit type 1 TsaB [Bacteroidetes bacterium]|nr:tRNA (adenosine(37)-N6)-threonylcarbamoyltransferase complex dimerization subunit type 1 TsaB [Bacteroidota bacterium]
MNIYLLHIETSTKVCSVAISLNGDLLELVESNDEAYSHGEKLTLFIQDVIGKAGISINDLSGISLASGPGSYTGLRIGVSVAKGICYALKIPLIGIDSLTSLHEIAKLNHSNIPIACLMDARRMEVYSAIYSVKGEVLKEISADVLDNDSYAEFDHLVCVGDGAEKTKELWLNRNYLYDLSIRASAKGQVKLGFQKFQNSQFEDLAYFEPFYLKDFYTPPPKKNKV